MVLIADDDATIRELTKGALESSGFSVAEAVDGSEAMNVFEELQPDLVLCDVMMPEVDGYELCSALRKMPNGGDVPVVMLTGLDDMESIEKAYSAGATEFIGKPVNWLLLPRRVQYILRANRTLKDLKSSEERYALAAKAANDGLWDWDLETNKIHLSPRWKAMLGHAEDDIGDDPEEWLRRIHSADVDRVKEQITAHIDGEIPSLECEYRMLDREGKYLWMASRALAMRDPNGRAYRMTGSQTDVSSRKRMEMQLRFNALHDALTGLPNRSLFLDRLTHCIKRARRQKKFQFAVVFLDLDRFKVINDSLGHLLGDRLLAEVGNRVKDTLRSEDTLARLGGDEFTILFEEVKDFADVTRSIERIQECLSEPIKLDDHEVVVSSSMGIAVSTTGYEKPEDMIRDADLAMYQAKLGGRARYEMFDAEMYLKVRNVLETDAELRAALEKDELRLHYQPILSVSSGEAAGFEALLRWQHPMRGLLRPDTFLQIAQDTRLIVPIGNWVLREACRQMSEWHKEFPGFGWFVSVNVSTLEMLQPDMVENIDNILEETGLEPEFLRLEITETSLIADNGQSLQVTERLQERGIQICICDFGAESSLLGYMRQFPFKMVKITRSLIKDLESQDLGIIKALFELTNSLGVQTVAEIGESTASLDRLKEFPCEFAQGYSISTPVAAEQISDMLETRYRQTDGSSADSPGRAKQLAMVQ